MPKRKKDESSPKGAPAWMTSYSDLMSLLLCFFVMLYAMSDLNEEAFLQLLASFGNQNINMIQQNTGMGINSMLGSGIMQMPTPEARTQEMIENYERSQQELNNIMRDFETYFAENDLQDQVDVVLGDNYVLLVFSDMLFESGSANLTPATLYILERVAEELTRHYSHDIRIEGHTDNVPINTPIFMDNWYLSSARAISVGNYFINEHGINPERIGAEGFGEHRPIAPNNTPEGRAQNRRVEIRIIGN